MYGSRGVTMLILNINVLTKVRTADGASSVEVFFVDAELVIPTETYAKPMGVGWGVVPLHCDWGSGLGLWS